jgi:DNA-directed RNA polymerase subunit K/omega
VNSQTQAGAAIARGGDFRRSNMDRNLVYELSKKCGGVFKFTVLMQKRIRELVSGQPKLADIASNDPKEIALREIQLGLIELEYMTPAEIEEMQRSLEEQAAAQALLQQDTPVGGLGGPTEHAVNEFLKSS